MCTAVVEGSGPQGAAIPGLLSVAIATVLEGWASIFTLSMFSCGLAGEA